MGIKKSTLGVLAAITLAIIPALGVHAAPAPQVVINGLTFTQGATVPACAGVANVTVVGVYGSSALATFIKQAAQGFAGASCANGIDVEYLAGGDSCPGDVFASGLNTADPGIGVSDVFSAACAVEGLGSVSNISDTVINVNAVLPIAGCNINGASTTFTSTVPQGGVPFAVTSPVTCGNGLAYPQASVVDGGSGARFCTPDSLSVSQLQALFSNLVTNFNQVGGCNSTVAGVPQLAVQNRVQGSGTRVTWCFNVFQNGLNPSSSDSCANAGKANGFAATTGAEVTAVCGGGDGAYTLGYASRAGLINLGNSLVSPTQSPSVKAGCGIVAIGGANGWNATCNPTSPSGPFAATSPVNASATNCQGDNQIASSSYPVWGYEHIVTVQNTTNAAVASFLSYVNTNDTVLTQQNGFIRQCQMGFARAFDGAPISVATASC